MSSRGIQVVFGWLAFLTVVAGLRHGQVSNQAAPGERVWQERSESLSCELKGGVFRYGQAGDDTGSFDEVFLPGVGGLLTGRLASVGLGSQNSVCALGVRRQSRGEVVLFFPKGSPFDGQPDQTRRGYWRVNSLPASLPVSGGVSQIQLFDLRHPQLARLDGVGAILGVSARRSFGAPHSCFVEVDLLEPFYKWGGDLEGSPFPVHEEPPAGALESLRRGVRYIGPGYLRALIPQGDSLLACTLDGGRVRLFVLEQSGVPREVDVPSIGDAGDVRSFVEDGQVLLLCVRKDSTGSLLAMRGGSVNVIADDLSLCGICLDSSKPWIYPGQFDCGSEVHALAK